MYRYVCVCTYVGMYICMYVCVHTQTGGEMANFEKHFLRNHGEFYDDLINMINMKDQIMFLDEEKPHI